jgi:hypothetical protein
MYKKLHRLSLNCGKKKDFLGKEKRRVNTDEATRPLTRDPSFPSSLIPSHSLSLLPMASLHPYRPTPTHFPHGRVAAWSLRPLWGRPAADLPGSHVQRSPISPSLKRRASSRKEEQRHRRPQPLRPRQPPTTRGQTRASSTLVTGVYGSYPITEFTL